jgi:hypothetical protein
MAQVNSTPGQNQTFANAAVPASQISTQSNLGVGLIPAQGVMLTTVAYGQHEPGLLPPANGPVRS